MTVAWVYGGILVLLMAIFVFYLVRVLYALQSTLEAMRQLIASHENQLNMILCDIEETLESVKTVTSRVSETVEMVTLLPHSASSLGKALLNGIFGKKGSPAS